jgi:hypothetical protein
MAAKAKTPARAATPPPAAEPPDRWSGAPRTLEERLSLIEAMRQRIDGYVQFICQVRGMTGTSAEAKEKAVKAFYERMVVADLQLGKVEEELRLG